MMTIKPDKKKEKTWSFLFHEFSGKQCCIIIAIMHLIIGLAVMFAGMWEYERSETCRVCLAGLQGEVERAWSEGRLPPPACCHVMDTGVIPSFAIVIVANLGLAVCLLDGAIHGRVWEMFLWCLYTGSQSFLLVIYSLHYAIIAFQYFYVHWSLDVAPPTLLPATVLMVFNVFSFCSMPEVVHHMKDLKADFY